jgi:arginine deiminase
MHIDTIFTQVKKDVWVMMGLFSEQMSNHNNQSVIEKTLLGYNVEKAEIVQFSKANPDQPIHFSSLEALLRDISLNDLGCSTVKIIFSGNNEYPYAVREQWTDSCNLLALKEGVVLSYDRNEKTNAAFANAGFKVVKVQDLIADLEGDRITTDQIQDTVVIMPSAELSRARGGFHCMSMPINRE